MTAAQGVLLLMLGVLALWITWSSKSPAMSASMGRAPTSQELAPIHKTDENGPQVTSYQSGPQSGDTPEVARFDAQAGYGWGEPTAPEPITSGPDTVPAMPANQEPMPMNAAMPNPINAVPTDPDWPLPVMMV